MDTCGEKTLFTSGLGIMELAETAEKNGQAKEAYRFYRDAVGAFQAAVKNLPDSSFKRDVFKKVAEIEKRKKALLDAFGAQIGVVNTGGGGGGGQAAAGSQNDPDGDDAKLRNALARSMISEKPNVKWDDIAGLARVKHSLKQTIILPIMAPELFEDCPPIQSFLFFGPPGTGKSLLAKAVATEVNSPFFSISTSDLASKWHGESARLVKILFQMARESTGDSAVIFIDEIDSICKKRNEGGHSSAANDTVSEFLSQMEGVGREGKKLLVMGATNLPWTMDSAVLRRFEKLVYIPLPEEAEVRESIVRLHLGNTRNNLNDEDVANIAERTNGASASEIKRLVKIACMEPISKISDAKQFMIDDEGFYHPCAQSPNCFGCPQDLSSDSPDCQHCGAKSMTFCDVPKGMHAKQAVVYEDFEVAMSSIRLTDEESLKRFADWMSTNGEYGA